MGLSSKIKYGVRLMTALAKNYPDKLTSVREISEYTGVSAKYLEQIIPELKAKKFISSTQGKYGGYKLLKSPESITLYDIYIAYSKTVLIGSKKVDPGLKLDKLIWKEMENTFIEQMKKVTVKELASKMK